VDETVEHGGSDRAITVEDGRPSQKSIPVDLDILDA